MTLVALTKLSLPSRSRQVHVLKRSSFKPELEEHCLPALFKEKCRLYSAEFGCRHMDKSQIQFSHKSAPQDNLGQVPHDKRWYRAQKEFGIQAQHFKSWAPNSIRQIPQTLRPPLL